MQSKLWWNELFNFYLRLPKNIVLESWDTISNAVSQKHTQVCSVYYFNISSQAVASIQCWNNGTHNVPTHSRYAVLQNDVWLGNSPHPQPPTSYLMGFSLVETSGVSARTGTIWEGRSSQQGVSQLALIGCGGHQLVWTWNHCEGRGVHEWVCVCHPPSSISDLTLITENLFSVNEGANQDITPSRLVTRNNTPSKCTHFHIQWKSRLCCLSPSSQKP